MSSEYEVSFYTNEKKVVEGDVGIEIEVEPVQGKILPVINDNIWTTKSEGSLRDGGLEYVTTLPIKVDSSFRSSIEQLTSKLEQSWVSTGFRTSIHVHKNATKMTMTQLWTSIIAYWLVENLLFEYCGEDRKSNLFCLRLKDAEGVTNYVSSAMESYHRPFGNLTDAIRYGGLNLNALWKFGSLEFRGMRGSIDTEEIEIWSRSLNDMVENTIKNFKNPESLMDFYYKNDWKSVVMLLFPNKMGEFMTSLHHGSQLVEENAYRLIKLAYKNDWNHYDKIVKTNIKTLSAKKSKGKKISFASMDDSWDSWAATVIRPQPIPTSDFF